MKRLAQDGGAGGVLFKSRNERPVTRPNKWLRKYSMGALPQFMAANQSEMPLVAPRARGRLRPRGMRGTCTAHYASSLVSLTCGRYPAGQL
ncbi:hypothetical protein [Kocuria rosea]|uniref:hypothetical protein n=1 Tax=Kocuria rosea TaxID=1275 RepID=UPI003CC81A93